MLGGNERTDLQSPSGHGDRLKADGTYSFVDTLPAGGKVTYTLKYAGDTAHASGTGSVNVSRATTTLTLNNNGKVYSYGAGVTFTAHLSTTYKNRKVETWADPSGSDKPNTLVKSGTVNYRKRHLQFQIYYNGTWYDNGSKYFTLRSCPADQAIALSRGAGAWPNASS